MKQMLTGVRADKEVTVFILKVQHSFAEMGQTTSIFSMGIPNLYFRIAFGTLLLQKVNLRENGCGWVGSNPKWRRRNDLCLKLPPSAKPPRFL